MKLDHHKFPYNPGQYMLCQHEIQSKADRRNEENTSCSSCDGSEANTEDVL